MPKQIYCQKLNENLDGFDTPPYPGELGQRICDHISQKAWNEWLAHQTMLINEYRLSLIDPKARDFLETEMVKYFFGEGSETPPDFQQ